jgi:hypothetical protein
MQESDMIRIVTELSDGIRDEIIRKIQDGTIPESWDGVELRELLMEKHLSESFFENKGASRKSKRYKDYRNFKLTRNI